MKYSTLLLYLPNMWNLSRPLLVPLLVAVCIHISKCFIQGVSVQAHSHNHCYAHTVDYMHGLGWGWAGSGNVWEEVAKDPDKTGRKAGSRIAYPTGRARALDSPGGFCCCFIFVMAAVQTEVSLCSQPWQRPLYIYGGLACNSLMAGKWFLFLFGQFSSGIVCLERNEGSNDWIRFFISRTNVQTF